MGAKGLESHRSVPYQISAIGFVIEQESDF